MSNTERNRSRREKRKRRRAENLAAADDTGWTKHTAYHWSASVNGLKLEYWPSTQKAAYNGQIFKNVVDINELKQHLKGAKANA